MFRYLSYFLVCLAIVVVGNALSSATADWSGGQSGGPPACNVDPKTVQCNTTPGYCEYTQNVLCGGVPCGTLLAAAGTVTLCPDPPTLKCDANNYVSQNVSATKCQP